MQELPSRDWLVSCSVMSSRCAHVAGVMSGFSSSLRLKISRCIYATLVLLVHPSVHGRLGYLYLVALLNNDTMNTGIQVSL